VIWKVKPEGSTTSRLVRARAASLGPVAALGFLLMVSLVMSAAITALGTLIDVYLPFGKITLGVLNAVISFVILSLLFAAIYKILPNCLLEWRMSELARL
jgi:membrane protein